MKRRLDKEIDARRAGYGMRTKDEIRADILQRMSRYVAAGVDPDDAMTKASADVRNDIETEWAGKTDAVLSFLKGKG
jgi:archaellum biogenesis protein FlaJ (TadC family)